MEDVFGAGEVSKDDSGKEAVALEYATVLTKTMGRGVEEDLWAKVEASFTQPERLELTWFIGVANLLNIWNSALGIEGPEAAKKLEGPEAAKKLTRET